MTITSNPINVRGLCQHFQGRSVLEKITMTIAEAECVAITGPNGSGKTTLLRCLAGACSPTAGTVTWYAHSRPNVEVRRLVGLLAHEPQIYPQLTARENLIFAARMTDVSQPRKRTEQLLELSGLRLAADHLPVRLSRGMLQRLAILRAIIHDPKIVLLDEPFTGLDQPGRDWLHTLLSDYCRQGRVVCFTSHDARACARLAQRVLQLQHCGLREVNPESLRLIPGAAA